MKRKLLITLLSLLTVLCCAFGFAACYGDTDDGSGQSGSNTEQGNGSSENGTEGLAFTLNADGESYSLSGIGTATEINIEIPATYEGKPVTSIGNSAFSNCRSLKSITIPDGVTSINYSAFSYCSSLESIIIPDSITSIAKNAFSGCDSLAYNEYDGACYLGNSNNPYLVFVSLLWYDDLSCNINENTKLIYPYAFSYRLTLESITIPNSVISISEGAFDYCEALTNVIIPDSVTAIGKNAFNRCTALRSITIPDSVTLIDESAFIRCESLTDIYYKGTKEQWGAIIKGYGWNFLAGNYTVHCAGGVDIDRTDML